MLAAAEPHTVHGVILAATFVTSPHASLACLRFAVCPPLVAAFRLARRLPVWLMRSRDDPLRIAKRETWSRVSAHVLAARARSVLHADTRETLGRCRQPVLSLTYAADDVVPARCSAAIGRHCPHARHVALPGSHFAMFTDPGATVAEVVRFIEVDCAPLRV